MSRVATGTTRSPSAGSCCRGLTSVPSWPRWPPRTVIVRTDGDILVPSVDYQVTSLRLDPDYIFYYIHWTRLLATGIIPIIHLAITNTAIIIKIKRRNTLSYKIRHCSPQGKFPRQGSKTSTCLVRMIQRPRSSTLTLTLIILLYLFCNLPRLALNLVEYLLMPEIYQLDKCGCYLAPWWLSSLIRSSHLLLTFNSSVNILIYVFVCKRFKKVFNIKMKRLIEYCKYTICLT